MYIKHKKTDQPKDRNTDIGIYGLASVSKIYQQTYVIFISFKMSIDTNAYGMNPGQIIDHMEVRHEPGTNNHMEVR